MVLSNIYIDKTVFGCKLYLELVVLVPVPEQLLTAKGALEVQGTTGGKLVGDKKMVRVDTSVGTNHSTQQHLATLHTRPGPLHPHRAFIPNEMFALGDAAVREKLLAVAAARRRVDIAPSM